MSFRRALPDFAVGSLARGRGNSGTIVKAESLQLSLRFHDGDPAWPLAIVENLPDHIFL